eukprot:CAMPEP_0184860000 /NCGR_PEP_ID=MMETSP0580-20130426/4958_1 /TAXON_ID=1118495 /ORGANISM="Dactyliosolen fragilissimus" /LENGTH=568 /DNA_ID=CAMNT_0027356929 /DNA_START=109 /DNA_END=1815 /DNA_ORIENTATION=+
MAAATTRSIMMSSSSLSSGRHGYRVFTDNNRRSMCVMISSLYESSNINRNGLTNMNLKKRNQNQNQNWYSRTGMLRSSSSSSSSDGDKYPPHTIFPMPALSPTMETGSIAKWNMEVGSSFSAGDILCEIETDKATVDFEAQDDGVLAKILRDGDDAKDLEVGVPICVVVDEEEDVVKFADFTLSEVDVVEAESSQQEEALTDTSVTTPTTSSTSNITDRPHRDVPLEHVLSPAARHISQSMGLDATYLEGSGRQGRVTKSDLLLALKNGVSLPALTTITTTTNTTTSDTSHTASTPSTTTTTTTPSSAPTKSIPSPTIQVTIPTISTTGPYEDIPNNNMRKVIAKRLTESKSTVPHFYSTIQVELDAVLALRKELQSKHSIKVSVNDLVLRSSALALRDVPEVNSSYDPKSKSVSTSSTVDISVAVATPTGLITPIVPSADTMGLVDISDKVKDLATRARDNKLQPDEYQGGTFTISNLGMFGINEFGAVINPPQAAILAVGGGTRTIVPTPYMENSKGENVSSNKPGIKTVMTAKLSADRRVVDEPTAALFLQAFRYYLSKPELLLL